MSIDRLRASARPLATRAKHIALTYPQVYAPGLAGAAVRAITGGSKKNQSGQPNPVRINKSGVQLPTSHAMSIGDPGQRYAPPLPNNGRTSGILVAQAAAAPTAPTQPVNQAAPTTPVHPMNHTE